MAQAGEGCYRGNNDRDAAGTSDGCGQRFVIRCKPAWIGGEIHNFMITTFAKAGERAL